MLMVIPFSISTPVNAAPVNCAAISLKQRRRSGARSRECAPADDPARNKRKESGSQPLEVDGGRCQVGLDLHIGEATTDGAREPVPGLGFAVEAFRTSAMALVEPSILCAPLLATAAGAEQAG
jgi:hypothetical protein